MKPLFCLNWGWESLFNLLTQFNVFMPNLNKEKVLPNLNWLRDTIGRVLTKTITSITPIVLNYGCYFSFTLQDY